jgi:hypothetical protein
MSLFFIKRTRTCFSGVLIVRYINALVAVQKNWYRIDEKKKNLCPVYTVDENILFLPLKSILHAIDVQSVRVNIPKYSSMCWWEVKQRSDTCQVSSFRGAFLQFLRILWSDSSDWRTWWHSRAQGVLLNVCRRRMWPHCARIYSAVVLCREGCFRMSYGPVFLWPIFPGVWFWKLPRDGTLETVPWFAWLCHLQAL